MKILYISYFYPPLGGPATLRNLKTVRYLSEAGAQITVLTVDEIEYAYFDPDLIPLCRQEHLIRTASWDPMALLRRVFGKNKAASQSLYKNSPESLKLLIRRLHLIDEKIGWLPHLISQGRKILRQSEIDIIFVSCGPFSSAIGAYRLAQEFDKALVVDYRDYWTMLSDYDLMGNALNHKLSRAWEKKILQRANLVVTATQGIADALAQGFDKTLPQRTFVLYNGHDEQDYAGLPPARPSSDYYTLSYFGNIYARRSLKYLYQAIAEMDAQMLIPQNLRVLLYGNFNREVYQEIESSPIKDKIKIMPELSHHEALVKMQEADALILIIDSSSPKGTLTSKVFEYLRLSLPLLALVPQHGEAAALLRECGIDSICPMESVSAIKLCLSGLIEARHQPLSLPPALARYERKRQVNELYGRLGSTY